MTRGFEIDTGVTLVTEECSQCGIVFAMPSSLRQKLLEKRGSNGRSFYCPNGHQLHYLGKSAAEKLEEARREAELWKTRSRSHLDQLQASERSKAAIKGHLTRTKKRVSKGVCPCCNRFFENVHDHMATQHPEYVEDSANE